MILEIHHSRSAARTRQEKASYSLALLVGMGGIVASIIVALLTGRLLSEQAGTDFKEQANYWRRSLGQTLQANLTVLIPFRAYFAASQQVERGEFEIFAQEVQLSHPTILALEYAPCVSHAERAHFEATRTNANGRPLLIREMLSDVDRTLVQAKERALYVPVEFFVSREVDERVYGYDLMSEPVRARALRLALSSGEQTATSQIQLVHQTDTNASFLVFQPIPTRHGPAPSPDAPAWERYDGVVAAAFNVAELVKAAIWDEDFRRALRIDEIVNGQIDGATRGEEFATAHRLFPPHADTPPNKLPVPRWSYEVRVQVDDHTTWRLTFVPSSGLLGSRSTGIVAGLLAVGFLLTGLVVSRLIISARWALTLADANRRLQQALDSEELALREATLFDAITQKINSGWSLHQILDYIYESLFALLPYDRIAFAVLERDGRHVHSVWSRSRGRQGDCPNNFKTSLDSSGLDDLLRNGQPRVLGDLRSFLQAHPNSRSTRSLVEDGMRSNLTCPLTANGKTVGFLSFSCRRAEAYTQAHVERFARVARQVSVTVERARYCEELEAEMERRRQAERALRRVYESPMDRYQAGGSLRYDSPSYVERSADRQLFESLMRSELCYVLTSRQMGKSSLMARTAERLRQQSAKVLIFDLSAVGQHVTADQWYYGLLTRMGWQLNREDDLEHCWLNRSQLGPALRFFTTLRTSLCDDGSSLSVVFIDELDSVRSLPFSSNEFFASIREFHNSRACDATPNHVGFCLLGAAPPAELVRNPEVTPFNVIGRRVVLHDFTATETASLAPGLDRPPNIAEELMRRVYHWTNGQPYLVQRLCRGIVADPTVQTTRDVDELCDTLFFSASRREEDVNITCVRDSLLRSSSPRTALQVYGRVRAGEIVSYEPEDAAVLHLQFCGLVHPDNKPLKVRNRIYEQVFNSQWVERQLERLRVSPNPTPQSAPTP